VGGGMGELYLGNFSVQISMQVILRLLSIDKIAFTVESLKLSIAPLIIMLLTLGVFFFSCIRSLSSKMDYLCGFVLLSLMIFFMFRDTWEHHYVMIPPLLILMYCTGRMAFGWTLAIFLLTATPTAFPLLHFQKGIEILKGLHLHKIVFYGYFFIKQAGIVIFFWQTLRAGFSINHYSST
jgi:hypothetical protein